VFDLFYERSDEKIKLTGGGKSTRWANTLLTDDLQVLDVEMFDASGLATDIIPYKDDVTIRIRFLARRDLKVPVFLVGFHTTDFLYLTRHHSERQLKVERLPSGEYEVVCRITQCPLLPGIYALLLGISEGLGASGLFYGENLVHFQVKNNPTEPLSPGDRDGFFALDATWSRPRAIASSNTRLEAN
jgi:lipopolysaccharide transport system ATP-binding protein